MPTFGTETSTRVLEDFLANLHAAPAAIFIGVESYRIFRMALGCAGDWGVHLSILVHEHGSNTWRHWPSVGCACLCMYLCVVGILFSWQGQKVARVDVFLGQISPTHTHDPIRRWRQP